MYKVKPLGINIKDNERVVKDGFLQESINLQWRDNSFKPIPERLISDINTDGYTNIIFHKVSDENQINVLGVRTEFSSTFLAFDLAGDLGGENIGGGYYWWFGTITDGVFQAVATPLFLGVKKTDGLSFTVLNGILYFMGDGSNSTEEYYQRLQYSEADGFYEFKNMYAWKTLLQPSYPFQDSISLTAPIKTHNVFSQCGLILVRFALVLDTGEVVLPSPIYGFALYGINRSSTAIEKGDAIDNIHAFINLNLDFINIALYNDNATAINFYASTPYYESVFTQDYSGMNSPVIVNSVTVKGEFQKKAEEPFYLIKTIEKPSNDKIMLSVGAIDSDIETTETYSKIDISSIAAGEVMPVDNFTYHKLYGRITSFNGRLIIEAPKTILSKGHIYSLGTIAEDAEVGYVVETEDGTLNGIAGTVHHRIEVTAPPYWLRPRGLLSYPDYRASQVGVNGGASSTIYMYDCRKNAMHNLSCAFDFAYAGFDSFLIQESPSGTLTLTTNYNIYLLYGEPDEEVAGGQDIVKASYRSENRIQFSAAGEFRVFPAINSYRIGDGRIIRIGTNSVNPSNADIISPLIVGTSDGIYTVNLDPTGNNLVASVTKTKNIPYISSEVLEIAGNLVFVSDKGLMVINNGDVINLTEDFFSDQGNGDFPNQESVYPSYNTLTADFFGGAGNPYVMDDIVSYMKGALLAYDGRRNTIWCSNPNKNFSLLFNLNTKMWGMSTLVFTDRMEYFSLIGTDIGDIYTRFMVKKDAQSNLLILSGEDMDTEVDIHLLTRSLKFQNPEDYKLLDRMFSRCTLVRSNAGTGYFSFGLWGRQDVNKYKKSIAIASKKDDRAETFLNDIRQDIPINCRKGKYKLITILQSGKVLPESSIDGFDFEVMLVDNSRMR